ncbi:zinc finger protein 271-like [Macrobrachium rosenbergii]|uniref:zinc finger protein 271-like n=1 Tax=Macrobrachium rosenbergii TaxID=79674 RepID=UPI0034D667E5
MITMSAPVVMNFDDSLEMFSSKKSDATTNSQGFSSRRIIMAAKNYDKEKGLGSSNQTAVQEAMQPVFFSGKSYTKTATLKVGKISANYAGTGKTDTLPQIVATSENQSFRIQKLNVLSLNTKRSEGIEKKETSDKKSFDNSSETDHTEVHEFVRSIEAQFGSACGKVSSGKRLKATDSCGNKSPTPSCSNEDSNPVWFSCDRCHLEFSSRKSLANHAKTHPKLMVEKNTCVYCGEKTEDPKSLSNHFFKEHLYDVSNFSCESCQVECISADLFDKHQYSCHRKEGTNSLICPICDKVYYDNDIFLYHKTQQKQCHICCLTFCMTSHQFKVHKEKHTLYKYKCEHCSASFVTKASLTKHLDSENSCAQKYKSNSLESVSYNRSCTDSVSETTSDSIVDADSSQLETNACNPGSMSHGPETEKCLLCSAEFVHLKNLWRHVAVVHETEIQGVDLQHLPSVKSHHCTICDKKFTRNSSLVSHMASHIDKTFNEKDGKPQCSVCHKTFQAKRYLIDHMRLHSDNQTYVCQCCNRKFLRKSHLKLHMEIHNSVKKFYACPYCEKSYMKKKDQVQHIRQKHNTPPSPSTGKDSVVVEGFPCPTCNKHFATALKLRMHEISHTVSKPPYTCLECSRTFPSLNTLKRHYLVHWDVRPFTCSVCSRAFRHSQSLKRHMTTHTGEKPYTCKLCGKSFSLKGTLNCHMLIHSNHRGFTCYKCNGVFVSKRKLKLHTCCSQSQEENQEDSSLTERQNSTPYTDLQNSSVLSDGNADSSISHMINSTIVNNIGHMTHLLAGQGLNSISSMPAHLMPDNVRNNIVSVASELVPASKLNSSNVAPLSESKNGSNTSKISGSQSSTGLTVNKGSGNVAVYQDGIHLDRVPNQTSNVNSYHQTDVLSQAFAVMGDNLMQDCVSLGNCSVLEAKPGLSIGPDTTVYTFVRVEGQDPTQTLISIPTVSESGAEENVTLQINLSDDCPEVFIIES